MYEQKKRDDKEIAKLQERIFDLENQLKKKP
jgi:hypothetical protein